MDEVFIKIKCETLETVGVEFSTLRGAYELFYRHIVFMFDHCEFDRGYVYHNYDGSLAFW